MMKQSKLQFTEGQLLRIVEGLGAKGHWRHALSIVEWVYNDKDYKKYKSRYVYTKLLSVLGKARRPREALQIFNLMSGDYHIYPDMAAYHSIAVTLGQAGHVKELLNIVERMRQNSFKKGQNMRRKNWDPTLEPDVVIYNAVINACVSSRQWKGVSWVFEQLRKSSLKPNGASYGLAMEVMLESGKYELVHEFFRKMRKSGEAPKALNYKVLVKSFWKEHKVDEAVQAIRDMERRGVVGTASVYYELVCCLCNNGRWQDAMTEIEKLKRLPRDRPLEITFTGMITSSMDGGYVDNCISIFEHMQDHCVPNIGTINAMLKLYGRNDMFSKAKELFEEITSSDSRSNICLKGSDISLGPDSYTYSSMLEASASAYQWEYFEFVYKEMGLSGYRLDQNKHASLLVKASKAGKWHLLEHAFDSTLEAGEVPHPSFFTELVCQAMSEQNFERAITLVNTLAYAPFHVSEKQWTDLFTKNGDRISRNCLEKLWDVLGNSEVAEEVSVSNLARSLRSIRTGRDADTCTPLQIVPVGHSDSSTRDDADMNHVSNEDSQATPITHMDNLTVDEIVDNLVFGENIFGSNRNSQDKVDDIDLNLGSRVVHNSCTSDSPSAYKILDSWKESRNRDGKFLNFQSSRKANCSLSMPCITHMVCFSSLQSIVP